MGNKKTVDQFIKEVIRDPATRTELVKRSHLYFFYTYFSDHVTFKIADFQKEWFLLTEKPKSSLTVIVAFRGSAKSTIMTLSYVLWAILGAPKKKFVLILSQTQDQARTHFKNIKKELEENKLLKNDLGPFKEDNEWNSSSIILQRYNARITAASTEQSIRGMRHGPYRPDLIICDDVEDTNSVKTREGRNKTYDWFNGEVVPLGSTGTEIIVIGNLLHEDSLIMRIKEDITEGKREGIFKKYPLLEGEKCLWPGKYPGPSDVKREERKIGNEIAWQREMMLKIISEEDQIVKKEWIQYYDELPKGEKLQYVATGVDLAISKNDAADFTAMVSGKIYGNGEDLKVYLVPNPICERLDFPETQTRIKGLSAVLGGGHPTELYIEEVGYQKALIDQLKKEGFPAEGFKVHGADKRSRLAMVTSMIQSGVVLFPRKGAEAMIQQLTGFGTEKHDDLADAFVILLLKVMEKNIARGRAFSNKPEGW